MSSNYPDGVTSHSLPHFEDVEKVLAYACDTCGYEIEKEHTVDPTRDNLIEDTCPECGSAIVETFTPEDLRGGDEDDYSDR